VWWGHEKGGGEGGGKGGGEGGLLNPRTTRGPAGEPPQARDVHPVPCGEQRGQHTHCLRKHLRLHSTRPQTPGPRARRQQGKEGREGDTVRAEGGEEGARETARDQKDLAAELKP